MTEIVIMAGGRGLRLGDITDHIPKPMVKGAAKPLLEELVEKFIAQGFTQFTFCVHYRAEQIMEYFGDGHGAQVRINYVHEREPLGTAGGLRQVPQLTDPFIVMNADIVTELRVADLISEHVASKMPLTVALAEHQYQVPFGVAEVDRGCITELREKPIVSWLVSAGIYCMSPRVIDLIPIEGAYNMSDLIERTIDEGVNTYMLPAHWADVGTWESLEAVRSGR